MARQIRDKLQQLYIDYKEKLPDRIAEIERAWLDLCTDWNQQNWDQLFHYTHTLTGSAGTYGYHQLSTATREVTKELKKFQTHKPSAIEISAINKAIHSLKDHSTVSKVIDLVPNIAPKQACLADQTYLAYYLSTDLISAQRLTTQLSHLNLKMELFTQPLDLIAALNRKAPAIMILDLSVLEDEDIPAFHQTISETCSSALAISEDNNLNTHLKAVRLGCRSFFTKPLDINQLTDQICLMLDATADPYRILIVEDSVKLAEYFATILKHAGMYTSVITDPLKINHALVAFKPELILMDLYMPKISGLELAAVLRLQPNYATLPIVFLSAEDDKTKQLEAMNLGGDDFITKPVSPEYLIWSVKNRAARYRNLRNLMLKDNLTGLFNFPSLLHHLEVEMLRAQRQHTSLSFVMLDLDHFKKINDTHGHLVGNQVLKSVSLSLQKRLRRTDIAGRYGGEEFALLLPNTTYEEAFDLCNNLRLTFEKMQHHGDHKSFTVTFSAGIACYPPHATGSDIIKAADQALYRAKAAGRNRVF